MKRAVAIGAVAALLLCAPGCGGPDALMKEFLANVHLYADTLERREPREKQQAALERIRGTVEKVDRLKLGKEDQERLLARYEGEIKRAKERVEAARKAAAMEGGGADDPPELFSTPKPK